LNEKEEDRRRETEDGRQAAISSISFKDGRPKAGDRLQSHQSSIINHQLSITYMALGLKEKFNFGKNRIICHLRN
jgi:hypothetical protein